ncbi:MAG: hypothetical protein ACQXXG_07425 [Candidatus Bathyarchaeia archaeon]
MKLIRFRHEKGESYGFLTENGKVVCLPSLAKSLHKRLPKKLEEFIDADIVKKAEEMLEKPQKTSSARLPCHLAKQLCLRQ